MVVDQSSMQKPAAASVQPLVIAISSRVLFDLYESHKIFLSEGLASYERYQLAHERDALAPGSGLDLVQKILSLKYPETQQPCAEVVLLSRNSANTGLRIFNSIETYGLPIHRAVFTSGESPYRYVKALRAHLFLSADRRDVARALSEGCAAAVLCESVSKSEGADDTLRLAFDGDAVLFSDDAERIFQLQGLEGFTVHEKQHAHAPLPPGPFHGFLEALCAIQACYPDGGCPIRTALMTARSAQTHERVIRTLRTWGIRVDEVAFLSGTEKTEFLRAFRADVFFDDQIKHCLSAQHYLTAAHVPYGVMNESTG